MEDIQQTIDEAATAAVLLVATDYDGTLAPLVDDPATAEAHRESVVALKTLASMPQTHVAVISGRSLEDLARHLPEVDRAHLVGSNGSEFEAGFAEPISPQSAALLGRLAADAQRISAQTPGTMVEKKPAAIAFHYRNARDEKAAETAVGQLVAGVNGEAGVQIRQGKKVVELSVVHTDKGLAVKKLRQRVGATVVLFIGDDVTDEDVFSTLTGPDIAVKVGAGSTKAKYRVDNTLDVARLLASVAEKRSAWVAGSQAVPIERHSMLSDQRTCALVGPEGRITWMCLPRIDSAAFFAELLGGPAAGYFDVCPLSPRRSATQKYLGSSFVLQSEWDSLRVIDYMDCSGGRPFQRAGRTDLVRVLEGSGRAKIAFSPRINFGQLETILRITDRGIIVGGSVDPCVLYSPNVQWKTEKQGQHECAVAEVDVREPILLELRYGTASLAPPMAPERQRREQTQHFWSQWAATLTLPVLKRDLVLRSALVLRALCYGPTGAIAAAATTSLPESPGGVRNWDYRFCWPRDAALAAASLLRLGATGPAMKLLDWMLGILESAQRDSLIRPVYTVTGGEAGIEGVITELSGYLGSRPVRVGNVAAHQVQLDVLGPVAHLISMLAENGASLTQEHWRLTESMVSAVGKRWGEEDHGIWEIRGSRRHHVHSKVNCWQTIKHALHIAEYMGHKPDGWAELRDRIAEDVLTKGWNAEKKAFCCCYENSETDAATLSVGLSGLLGAGDPRFASTVEAVERDLRVGSTVYRYRYDDGLPGVEGGFNICTAWLIEAYIMLGRRDDAMKLFEDYAKLAGPTGLMAEEYDPKTKMALGNYPQAYSHIGLINCALRLEAST
jgi:trehalose-phosphatase